MLNNKKVIIIYSKPKYKGINTKVVLMCANGSIYANQGTIALKHIKGVCLKVV